MAGHSKWANIRFRKGAQDAKRGKLFTKLIREIVVAAKAGGPLMDSNPRLRDAVTKALKANMKRDAVDNAIKRGSGAGNEENLEEITYEGYGPNGIAILVNCLTDNINRTVAEVRHAFIKHGGNLGTSGSVAYQFSKVGLIVIKNADEEKLLEVALDAGADDVSDIGDNQFEVTTASDKFHFIKDALEKEKFQIESSDITMISQNQVEVDESGAESLLKLLDVIEDLDDVQNVYSNADIPDEVLAKLV